MLGKKEKRAVFGWGNSEGGEPTCGEMGGKGELTRGEESKKKGEDRGWGCRGFEGGKKGQLTPRKRRVRNKLKTVITGGDMEDGASGWKKKRR